MNTNNKVITVFDPSQMQKYFLMLTMGAEQAVFEVLQEITEQDIQLDDFFAEIVNMPDLKKMIQDLVLTSISNVDWRESLKILSSNPNVYPAVAK